MTPTGNPHPARVRPGGVSTPWWRSRPPLSSTVVATGGYLVVLGDRRPIAWVLSQQRMAFPAGRARSLADLPAGTRLVLYATRGAYHNPTLHRGRVIGLATTTSPVHTLDAPVRFGDREFTVGCTLKLEALTALHEGPELGPLAPRLHAFPKARAWSVYLRRPLVPLDAHDLRLLTRALEPGAGPPAHNISGYLQAAEPRP